MGGVPTVRAWRISADSLVENQDYGMTAEQIAKTYSLPVADVRTILAYALKAREIAHSAREMAHSTRIAHSK